jgi:ribonuclease HI
LEFYVDGSCTKNGSINASGGFGVVGFENGVARVAYAKRNTQTTNNREEIRAILYVLLNYGYDNPIVYSDSAYCVNTFNNWMYGWQRNGWVKGDNKPPENLDLIQAYWNLLGTGRRIQLIKTHGHAGIKGNELADQLATGKISPEEVLYGD